MSSRKTYKSNSLRQRAEWVLSQKAKATVPPEDVEKLIHELQVHQIELEMQNEELRKAETKLHKSENRYRELSANLLSSHERERKHIALEIHDSMGSSLASSKMNLEAALKEMGDDNSPAKVVLECVIPMIQGAMEEARRIQMSLRPSMLDDLGILATINWFCQQFKSTHPNIHIKQEIDIQEQEVPEALKIVIYRVLQEALNNIAKHSKASVALLCLRKARQSIELVIRDSGQGFDSREVYSRKGAAKSLGLESMRERTELSGGFFSVESSKGRGAAIKANWLIEQPTS